MVAPVEDRVADLERELRNLRTRVARLEAPKAEGPRPSLLPAERLPTPTTGERARVDSAAPASARPPAPRVDLEDLLGGRLLALVGGVAVLVGLAFLVALAIDRGWIGEWARVSLAFTGSLALLGGGVWLVERLGRTQAALAVVGTATAGLFLSVTAAGSLYGLVPDVVALCAALLVGAAGAALAVRWRSRSVAALGIGGALLAPVYAASFPSVESLTFLGIAYAASAAVLVWQRWEWLRVGAFALTTLQVAYWGALGEPSLPTLLVGLSVFALVGTVLALGYELRVPAEGLRPSTSLLLAVNALVVGGIGAVELEWRVGAGSAGAWVAALAAGHLSLGLGLLRVRHASRPLAYLLLGVGLIAADIAFAFIASGATLAVGWAASAVALAALGRRHGGDGDLVPLPLAGQLSLAITHTVLFADPAAALVGEGAVPFGPFIAIGAAAFGCARLARPDDSGWRAAADVTALATLAYLTAASLDGLALVAALGAEALALAHVARRTKEPLAEVGAFGFLGLALAHALAFEAPPVGLVDGVPGLAAALAALAVVAGVAARLAAARAGERRTLLALLAGGGTVYAVSVAIVTVVGSASASGSAAEVNQQAQTVLSAFWALCGVGALWVGLRRCARTLRLCGFGLLSLTVAKVFLFDMAALESGWRILSFVALGLLLLAGAFAYQRLRGPAVQEAGG